ncbi:class I SAM-dependent methyltransferase [Clavibacter tessellarius]
MDQSDLREVLSLEGLRLLDSLPEPAPGDDMVRIVSALRAEGHSPALVSAVLTQSRLRARARAKFGDFAERMLFTEAGLEQATRLPVAAQHAGRFQQAGVAHVADLGCGIGGDAMAMAAIGIRVTAVERDEVTAAVAGWNLAPFPEAVVEQGTAEAFDAGRVDGVYLDPARRTEGHSSTRRISTRTPTPPPSPRRSSLAAGRAAGIKLGPGLDRDLILAEAEAQWVSVDGQAVEMGLWFGPTRREGVRRAALVIGGGSSADHLGGRQRGRGASASWARTCTSRTARSSARGSSATWRGRSTGAWSARASRGSRPTARRRRRSRAGSACARCCRSTSSG